MNWIKKPWSRVLKNGLIISSNIADEDADFENYIFKEDVEDNNQAVGGVDIINYRLAPPIAGLWSVEFWGKYNYLQNMFAEKYCVEYETYEEATIVVDAFLDKIFDLKVFL